MANSPLCVADIIEQSGVAFGTSGARGLVSAMTDRVCHAYTTGFLKFLADCGAWKTGGRVALAGDLRPSTPRILAACAQAVRDLGGEPVYCGLVPTPALALWAFGEGARRDALFVWLKEGHDARRSRLDENFGPMAGDALTDIDDLDGVRMTFANGRIIHLRGSGNAPELRCYAEAENKALAEALSRQALALVAQRFPA